MNIYFGLLYYKYFAIITFSQIKKVEYIRKLHFCRTFKEMTIKFFILMIQ